MSYPQIWDTETDREKDNVDDRSAKLNEKKSDGQLEQEIKDKGDNFLLEEQHKNFVAAVGKIRNASGHQGENERQSRK